MLYINCYFITQIKKINSFYKKFDFQNFVFLNRVNMVYKKGEFMIHILFRVIPSRTETVLIA